MILCHCIAYILIIQHFPPIVEESREGTDKKRHLPDPDQKIRTSVPENSDDASKPCPFDCTTHNSIPFYPFSEEEMGATERKMAAQD